MVGIGLGAIAWKGENPMVKQEGKGKDLKR